MGLRPGRCHRRLERPYTRVSRYKGKGFVAGVPPLRIGAFEMGNKRGEFPFQVEMWSESALQIRENALESARTTANRLLEKRLGKDNYYFKLLLFPHHVLRERPLATGAGADRYQRGMQMAFGQPIGRAAQVSRGQMLMWVRVREEGIGIAKDALKQASKKLPCKVRIKVVRAG